MAPDQAQDLDAPIPTPTPTGTGTGTGNLPEVSVGELAQALKRTVETAFAYVRVRGEISQPKRHSSGHLYLRLKDEQAVLEAVCWRGTAQRLALRPEEGLEVICTGRLTTYPGRSQYQLVIESMTLAGQGALLQLLEERKRRLAAEGLFDPARKKARPFLPAVIGVITSPTGAVIRDILHRLDDRFPRQVLLWPVAVQGEAAAAQIVQAIEGFNRIAPGGPIPRPDLLIVARGGGSLEDMMAFNEEAVVRAAAASVIPLISAVGHETDTTLIDFASDLRAPTPTAAAELAVPVRAELIAAVRELERRQEGGLGRWLAEQRTRLEGLGRGLGDPRAWLEERSQRLDDRGERLMLALKALLERRRARIEELGLRLRHPRERLAEARTRLESERRALAAALRQGVNHAASRFDASAGRLTPEPLRRRLDEGRARLSDLDQRLTRALGQRLAERDQRLGNAGQLLESLSYRGVLARGFALVSDREHKPVTRAAASHPGQPLTLTFHDGEVAAVVASGHGPATPPRRKRATPEQQGSLF